MTYIIGLAGPAKVGKDTTAKNIIKSINKLEPSIKITHNSFAYKIYELTSLLTGLPIELLSSQEYKECIWNSENAPLPCLENWTPRKLLQKIGTECFRNIINDNFWIETTIKSVSSFDIAIISDVRFENECKYCDFVIELEREGVEYAKDHPSAMPINNELVNENLLLHPTMNYDIISKKILKQYYEEKGQSYVECI